ncbi:hypothetical protein Tco_0827515 [Tanacetum coccineum]
MGFVDGSCVKSDYVSSVPLSNQWERCNVVVLSWLLSSISEYLYLSQVNSENAPEVWKELKYTYDKLDGEFDILTKHTPCSCDAKAELGKHNQLMKLMQFLMGLDEVYKLIRSSLLTQPELPDVRDDFVIIYREESHRGLGSTFRVQNPQYNSLSCKNRGMKGHTIDRCFELIGYPNGFKKNSNGNTSNSNNKGYSNNNDRGGSSNNVQVQKLSGSLPFTNDQIAKLMSLICEKGNFGVQANMAGLLHEKFYNSLGSAPNRCSVVWARLGVVYCSLEE